MKLFLRCLILKNIINFKKETKLSQFHLSINFGVFKLLSRLVPIMEASIARFSQTYVFNMLYRGVLRALSNIIKRYISDILNNPLSYYVAIHYSVRCVLTGWTLTHGQIRKVKNIELIQKIFLCQLDPLLCRVL